MGSDSSFDTEQVRTEINALNVHYLDDQICNIRHRYKLYHGAGFVHQSAINESHQVVRFRLLWGTN